MIDVQIIISLLCFGISALEAIIVCPYGGYLFEGQCYKYFSSGMNWQQARDHCRNNMVNGDLAVAKTEYMFQKFQWFSSQHGHIPFFIGAFDPHYNRHFVWLDGSSCCDRWLSGEPTNSGGNEFCVEVKHVSPYTGYNDATCSGVEPFLCQGTACQLDHCVPGHLQCTGSHPTQQICSRCEAGFYWDLAAHLCKACHQLDHCVPGHIQCTGPEQTDQLCTQCEVGLYWDAVTYTCKECPLAHCVQGHVKCTGPQQSEQLCSQCEVGYYWDNVVHLCSECKHIDRCLRHTCTNGTSSMCLECQTSNTALLNDSVCFDIMKPAHIRCQPKCVVIFEEKTTWDIAKAVCEMRQGHLYVPVDDRDDQTMRNYLESVINAIHPTPVWIGGKLKTDNTEHWLNNILSTANGWTFWKPTSTSESLCIGLDPMEQYQWSAYDCDSERFFVCEEISPYNIIG